MTIRQAMSELVKQAGENDNISVLYVVDGLKANLHTNFKNRKKKRMRSRR